MLWIGPDLRQTGKVIKTTPSREESIYRRL